ncbi:UNVERIFIED_CONTAM: hypothetical protein NCL1_50909 [Trichonephila clavipes]
MKQKKIHLTVKYLQLKMRATPGIETRQDNLIASCEWITHKNTSPPNNPSKSSICISIYHKTHLHGEKSNTKILFTTFLKEKETKGNIPVREYRQEEGQKANGPLTFMQPQYSPTSEQGESYRNRLDGLNALPERVTY